MKKTFLLFTMAVFGFTAIAQNIAVGRNGEVVTTIDGGNNWVRKPTGSSHDVIGISKYSSNNWVLSQFKAGSGNFIQRTTDGGAVYTTIATNLNAANRSQAEMAHFGPDTMLLLSRTLPDNSVDGHSVSNLTAPTPTFANGGNSRAPYYGLTKYNATSSLAINNQTSGLPVNSSSEIYKFATKTATAGSYCFQATASYYEHSQLTGSVRVDANTLFVVGNMNGISYVSSSVSGYLYKSTDNGTTWSIVSLPSIPASCGLMSIGISPNKQNIVVAGSKNYVAYSSNSGSTWNASTLTGVQGTATNWLYTKIAFADDNTVIVGGSDQVSTANTDWYALRSTDGGGSFTAITTLTRDGNYTDFTESIDRRGSYHSIYFVNSTVGYAVMGRADKGKKYEIMKTTDAGATWTLITWATGTKPNVNSVEIINHLSNENDLVVNSLSGKNLWQIDISTIPVTATSIVSKYTTKDLRGTYKKSATEIYAMELATTASEGGVYKSTDGGLSWTLATAAANGHPMLSICEGFVGGYLGRAYIANIDFSTLTRTAVLGHLGGNLIDLSSTYKNVANTSSSTIFAIGEAGGIFKSTNAGVSFTYIGKSEWSAYTYTAINAVDANTVFICGYNAANKGIIIKTTNSGTDWTKLEFENVGKLNDIEMYSATQGLAVGDGGIILGTIDGTNWISKSPAGLTDDMLKVVCDEPVSVTGTPEITTATKLATAKNVFTYLSDNKLNVVAPKGSRVQIFNLLGVSELSIVMNSNNTILEVSNGAKIVKIEAEGAVYTSKVIIH